MANVLQPVLAYHPNSFGFLKHRGGRDTRVPVPRRYATDLCGITRSNASLPNASSLR
ncbi:MAG: hypothetical protein LBQ66_09790 [Planctomycetaceae bacterium]|nr:hypothetical protein [Planctomycetaceae bacterium]